MDKNYQGLKQFQITGPGLLVLLFAEHLSIYAHLNFEVKYTGA